MKQVVTLFPDEMHEVMVKARFDEKRTSMAVFVREAMKTYLRNCGYELPDEMEIIKQGPDKGWKQPITNLSESIQQAVTPDPTLWVDVPKWGD